MASPKFKLNLADGKSILKGLLIAVAGSALTYLVQVVPDVDLGVYAPAVVAGMSVLVNVARKWLASR